MSATDCKPCPEGVYCEFEGHAYAPIYINGADLDVCADTQTDYPNCETLCDKLVSDGVLDSADYCTGKYIMPCPSGYYCAAGSTNEYSLGATNVA